MKGHEGPLCRYVLESAQAHTGNNGKENLSKYTDGSPEEGRHFVGLIEVFLRFRLDRLRLLI